MPGLPELKRQDLIKALQKAGFEQVRQIGSRVHLKHGDGRVVTVPVHAGSVISRGLLRKSMRDADWALDDIDNFLK
jgi:predicted RNA binding protein YcfA (HicA-like mRNA interferase family)